MKNIGFVLMLFPLTMSAQLYTPNGAVNQNSPGYTKIGIGTSTPQHGLLEINGTGDSNGLTFWTNSGEATSRLWVNASENLFHITRGNIISQGLTLTANGKVAIGGSVANGKLDVAGSTVIREIANTLVNGDVAIYNHTGTTFGFLIRPYDSNFQGGTFNWNRDFGYREDFQSWYAEGGFHVLGGKLGVGTDNPSSNVDVVGTLRTSSWIDGGNYISVSKGSSYRVAMNGASHGYITGRDDNLNTKFEIRANGVTFFNGGNVGIGTATPNEKLTVNGTVYATEVKVDLNVPGPDYVFEKDYPLPSLADVKKFIDENKHLPEVPSAKEMEETGVKVGEMEMVLLKKIEELTLYQIEANRKIEQMTIQQAAAANQIAELVKEIDNLKKKNK